MANLSVIGIVLRKTRHLHRGQRDDAWQAGFIGLLRAAELYDPAKGWAFASLAKWHVLAAIQRWAAGESCVRVPLRVKDRPKCWPMGDYDFRVPADVRNVDLW